MKWLVVSLASASVIVCAPASAQTATMTGYGSAVYDTMRNCPIEVTIACDGRGTGQGVAQSARVGGANQAVTNTFNATGTGAGSNAYSSITFGDVGLPVIKTSVQASGAVRIGSNNYVYQSYKYTGADDFDLLINGSFHIDNSSTDGGNGTQAKGAIATAYFAIWNKADFFSYADAYFTGTGNFNSATPLINQGYLFGAYNCGDFANNADAVDLPHGALATGYGGANLGGGEATVSASQTNCHDELLTIKTGDEFVIASYTAVFANRDGFIDATGTYKINLDPSMGREAIQAFSEGVTFEAPAASTVPEPATWAMFIGGFGLIGGTMRRRKVAVGFA